MPETEAESDLLPDPENIKSFDLFYEIYPRHTSRSDALKAFQQQLRKGFTVMDIIEGVRKFAEIVRGAATEAASLPHPGSWLRAEGWREKPPPEPAPAYQASRRYTAAERHERVLTRPIMWWTMHRRLWHSDWAEADIPDDELPHYRKWKASPAGQRAQL